MSFHPLMAYDRARFQKSERKIADEGPPFVFTPERRAKLDDILTKYPPDKKRSAVLAALYLVQEQVGYVTAGGMRHVAGILDLAPAEVEDVATYYVMFFKEPVGKHVVQVCRTLSCALMGAERVTETLSEKLGIKVGETDASGTFTLLEFECLGACDRAPVIMVNNAQWYECVRPEDVGRLVDDLTASKRDPAFSGCHLKVEA
ncbi:MAG: NADH-quinone oxidoreductase subunit NuoE [Acidobacteria bacterium]|nr:NADH-quinone oxidoreductase subunit NuoE [Acidobacteriota bacterium]MCA1648816.1 NADH-quinone oxidoreductase subunit NuoE [Acidobacteriota bacterium]